MKRKQKHHKQKQTLTNGVSILVSPDKKRAMHEDLREGLDKIPFGFGLDEPTEMTQNLIYGESHRRFFLDLGFVPQTGRVDYVDGFAIVTIIFMLNPIECYEFCFNPHNADHMEVIKRFASSNAMVVHYPRGISAEMPPEMVGLAFECTVLSNLCRSGFITGSGL